MRNFLNPLLRASKLMPVLVLLAVIVALPLNGFSQLSEKSTPISFNRIDLPDYIPTEMMPALPMDDIRAEDIRDERNNEAPRFGYPFDVNLTLQNAGEWTDLPEGGRLWRLSVWCPGALSINLNWEQFWIPAGAQVHVYGVERKHIIGAFTAQNNRGTQAKPGKFATGLVYDDQVIIEYFEPEAVKGQGHIKIAQVIHGYRYITIPDAHRIQAKHSATEGYGGSGSCQVNMNCSEGNDWQDEKKGVAMMLINGTRWCSGSLINNSNEDGDLLYLTAYHCIDQEGLDATSGSTDASYFSFMWNYESPGCTSEDITATVTNGATLLSNWNRASGSDFALFRLDEDPRDAGEQVYFNGWNRTNSPVSDGVGIHHPSGDIKKVATHDQTPTTNGKYWRVNFDPTTNGHSVTEGGSSGSPLLDANGLILGQLFGGSSINCTDPFSDYSVYGKVYKSWDGDGTAQSRIKDYIDPAGTSPTSVSGAYIDNPFVKGETKVKTLNKNKIFGIWVPDMPSWESVNFSNSYTKPIVVFGAPGNRDSDPVIVRAKNVSSSGFEMKLNEWAYQDNLHQREDVSWMVMEEGTWTLSNGKQVVAGEVSAVDENWQSVSFGTTFSSTPAVIACAVTHNGSDPIVTRIQSVSTTGFQVRVQEEEAKDGTHADEVIHYIAIATGEGTDHNRQDVVFTGTAVDESWQTLALASYIGSGDPFLACMNSANGADPAGVRFRNQTSATSVQVKVQEEQSNDTETGHNYEKIGFIAWEKAGDITILMSAGKHEMRHERLVAEADGETEAGENLLADRSVKLYPNPAKDWFELRFAGHAAGTVNLEVLDMQGRMVMQREQAVDAGLSVVRMETTGMKPGLYLVRLHSLDGVAVKKITIQ